VPGLWSAKGLAATVRIIGVLRQAAVAVRPCQAL
jgi:hypothetical protein